VLAAMQAPFWLRHFTPLLPAVAGLTALALERVRGRLRAGGYALLAATSVANVVAVVYLICDRTNLSLQLFGRFTLG
jgi:Na+/H+ antiporter NhaA